jgi:type II secretory ATPase GspE/PulE/Tfp pilus assembly ATPase PilB-like protein
MLIGEILKQLYNIKDEEIQSALTIQQQIGGLLGQILIQQGIITETQLLGALSTQLNIKIFDKDIYDIDTAKIQSFFESLNLNLYFIIKQNYIPISINEQNKRITFITNDPLNTSIDQYIAKYTDFEIDKLLSSEQLIKELSQSYLFENNPDYVSLNIDESFEKLKEMASEAPIIRFLNNTLSRAVELRATDVHIEPMSNTYRIRFRIDGILHDIENLEETFYLAVVSRIKLLSGLDIAEKRLPQDGKFTTKIASSIIDIRVSTIPGINGEGVVLRILHRESLSFNLEKLGLQKDHAESLMEPIKKPFGMFLVTGPTGSGKTTTLYSILTYLNNNEKKIITVEDPVEYQLEGIHQVQVKSEIGFTFANALRSILRHDPDIIMIGEIRDKETAEIAIQSALTGHLVLSTLHTNDAPSSLFRLLEMGIEDYLLNASIIALMAQRIVRQNCPYCSEQVDLSPDIIKRYDLENLHNRFQNLLPDGVVFKKGKGCKRCANTGYLGRIAIFEYFNYTDYLKEVFVKTHSLEEFKKVLVKDYNYRFLREDGFLKVLSGQTTIEEVLRVT